MNQARKIIFALAPLCLLSGVGEVGARLVDATECGPILPSASGWETMVGDPRYLWKLEPGRLFESPAGNTQINAVGLRSDYLPSTPKRPGEKVVLITGDSSVYGWGQPDGSTYAELLEEDLERSLRGTQVRVVNLGIPGFSSEQTLRLLEDLGWSYEPDLIIVHNIFSDCNIDAFQDRTALALANPNPGPLQRTLHNSRLYCAAHMAWAGHQAGINQETNRVLMPGIPTGPNQAAALEVIDQVIDLSRVPLDDYLDNLSTIKAEAEQRGASMIVAPLAQEWDVGIWNVPMDPPSEGQILPWTPYREAQANWATENGVGRVDLPTAFANAPGDKARLFIDNMHPSVEGAKVMARAISEHVRRNPELLGQRTGNPHQTHQPGNRGGQTGGASQNHKPPGVPPSPGSPAGGSR